MLDYIIKCQRIILYILYDYLSGDMYFSPIEASAVEQSKIMNLVYDSKNSTGKDFILPDIGVSVKTAFLYYVSQER